FTATATLTNKLDNTAISNKTVNFSFGAESEEATTNSIGVAIATFTAPISSGTYSYSVKFNENDTDATYSSSNVMGSVSVLQRPTTIQIDNITTLTLDVFTATATLRDKLNNTAISNKTVNFYFEGNVFSTTTNSFGVAISTFTAPTSSGTYVYTATFDGDETYAESSEAKSVFVLPRETMLVVYDVLDAVTEKPFIAKSILMDTDATENTPIVGRTVKFTFETVNIAYGVTNELGIATVTFVTPPTPKIYTYTAEFLGDSTYQASNGEATVRAGLLTTLTTSDVSTFASEPFNVQAKLVDVYGVKLNNKPIVFTFLNQVPSVLFVTAKTNDVGIATATFTAPISSGTHIYTAEFYGDTLYAPSNSSSTINIQLRPTSILTYITNTIANSSFTAKIELKDTRSNTGIANKNINFVFNGSTKTVKTGSITTGVAEAEFFAVSNGSYTYTANFDGDDTYTSTGSTGDVIVSLRFTSMNVFDVTIPASSSFTAKIELKDPSSDENMQGKMIKFVFNSGQPEYVVTGTNSIAQKVFLAPMSSGTYTYTAEFGGDVVYSSSSITGIVSVGQRSTSILISNISARTNTPFDIEAKLIDNNTQSGVENKNLAFIFQEISTTSFTNSIGISTATFVAISTGTNVYSVSFVGDSTYSSSANSANVIVGYKSTILLSDEATVRIKDNFIGKSILVDSTGAPILSKVISFKFNNGDVYAGTTNDLGIATATLPTSILESTGTYNYLSKFDGDVSYVGGEDLKKVYVVLRETKLETEKIVSAPNKAFGVQVKLCDNVFGSPAFNDPIDSKSITFEFYDGISTHTKVATTNYLGIAATSFTALSSTGTYNYVAKFEGNNIYEKIGSNNLVQVLMATGEGKVETILSAEDIRTFVNEVFTSTATLVSSGIPVSCKIITFEFYNGVNNLARTTATTNNYGVATATFTALISAETTYTASFADDEIYSSSSDTAKISILKRPTILIPIDIAVYSLEIFTATSTLKDTLTSQPLYNKKITFEFFDGISTNTKTTDTSNSGVANVDFISPSFPGRYSYIVRFSGNDEDSVYAGTIAEGSIIVNSKGEQPYLILNDIVVGQEKVFYPTATFTFKGLPVKSKLVTFEFENKIIKSTTNVDGIATTSFVAPTFAGNYKCTATFAGDKDYIGVKSTATVSVVEIIVVEDPYYIKIATITKNKITFSWTKVIKYKEKIKNYVVEKTNSLEGRWEKVYSVDKNSALTFTDIRMEGETVYYRVKTIFCDGQESKGLAIIEVPNYVEEIENIGYIYTSEDRNAKVELPNKIMDDIQEQTVNQLPIRLVISKEENSNFLFVYDIKIVDSDGRALDDKILKNTPKGIRISVSYKNVLGVISAAGSSKESVVGSSGKPAAGLNGQQVAIYWFNSVEWIKLGGTNNIFSSESYIYSRTIGKFGLKAGSLAKEFTLTEVVPKIFTPEESSDVINKVRFIFENPKNSEVTIKIFDITGAIIKRNLERESDNILCWDGRDINSDIVRGGIYIYQIESEEKIITGTIVVAK
ncbi:MAG: hypothetical protein ABID79_05200, partial [Elusimicrobiota bacterium]